MEIRSLTVLGVESQNSRVRLPGDPVVKTPCFYCRGHRFKPWLGKFCMPCCAVKKKKSRCCQDHAWKALGKTPSLPLLAFQINFFPLSKQFKVLNSTELVGERLSSFNRYPPTQGSRISHCVWWLPLEGLYFFGLQNHCRWWLRPWN